MMISRTISMGLCDACLQVTKQLIEIEIAVLEIDLSLEYSITLLSWMPKRLSSFNDVVIRMLLLW